MATWWLSLSVCDTDTVWQLLEYIRSHFFDDGGDVVKGNSDCYALMLQNFFLAQLNMALKHNIYGFNKIE